MQLNRESSSEAVYVLFGAYFVAMFIQPIVVFNLPQFAAAGVTTAILINVIFGIFLYVFAPNHLKVRSESLYTKLLILYMIWSVLGLIAHPKPRTPTALLTWFSDAILFFGISRALPVSVDLKKLLTYIAVLSSVSLGVLSAYALAVSPRPNSIFIFYSQKVYFRNALAHYAVIAMLLAGAGINASRRTLEKVVCTLGVLLGFLVALLCASKTIWLTLPLTCLALAVAIIAHSKNKLIALVASAAAVILAIAGSARAEIYLQIKSLLTQYYYGGYISVKEREFIWEYTNSLFVHWWDYILGMGYNASVALDLSRGERIYSLHNDWLNLIFMTGFVFGPAIFVLNIVLMLHSGIELLKGRRGAVISSFFPFFVYIFLRGFSESSLGFNGFAWTLFFLICVMKDADQQPNLPEARTSVFSRIRLNRA
jgi:hypothetical protein